MSTKRADIATLDRWFPPRGPCAMCGHRDARHRLWDMLMNHAEPASEVAAWHSLPVEAVEAVRRVRPYRRDPVRTP